MCIISPLLFFLAQRIDQSCLCLQVRRIDDIWDLEEFFLTQELLEGLMEGKKWKQFWERKLNRWSFFTRKKNEPIENRMKVNKNETFQSMSARDKMIKNGFKDLLTYSKCIAR